ncbi:MAG: hypothetical protein ACK5KU_04370 [Beutenbergiaceae bacterium]
MSLPARLEGWRRSRNWVAVGNVGEHVTLRLLVALGYQVLGTQDDYLGMVPEVLGAGATAHPEDFIAVDPQGRLLTVNSKATASVRSCRITRDGNLTKPQIARVQTDVSYSTLRANLVSPLEGDCFAQVVKVDLRNAMAQIFEVGAQGHLTHQGKPIDVGDLVVAILKEHPHSMPPPSSGT